MPSTRLLLARTFTSMSRRTPFAVSVRPGKSLTSSASARQRAPGPGLGPQPEGVLPAAVVVVEHAIHDLRRTQRALAGRDAARASAGQLVDDALHERLVHVLGVLGLDLFQLVADAQ